MLIGILYALPCCVKDPAEGVLIGILFLNIGRLTWSNYKKKLPYGNLSSLIRWSNHLYFGKPFTGNLIFYHWWGHSTRLVDDKLPILIPTGLTQVCKHRDWNPRSTKGTIPSSAKNRAKAEVSCTSPWDSCNKCISLSFGDLPILVKRWDVCSYRGSPPLKIQRSDFHWADL